MKKFNWCFIGCGKLAEQVAREITNSGRHSIVSVYTRRFPQAQQFAQKYGATAYESAEDAINNSQVDGVYVVTPHNAHFRYAKMALELGKPTLVEKPFTVEASETEQLIELAKQKNVYLAEAMWSWFCDTAHEVKKLIDGGAIGNIQTAWADFSFVPQDFSRLTDPKRAGGALLDIGIYPITYMYRFFGKPDKIECRGVVENGIDVDEIVILTFGNLQAKCVSSFRHQDCRIKIEGAKGTISSLLFHKSGVVTMESSGGHSTEIANDGSYLNEFDKVAQEITLGLTESKYVPFSATQDIMEILDECREQLNLKYDCE